MENNIMVSICCLAYNHRKYIKKTLDSFLNQKTNFKYEILIHDDCSTDGTTEIIKEYESKYPKLIKSIYQKENQYSQGIRVSFEYQFSRAKGKYIAMCEGDDYWIDENKLQLQFDSMEVNKNCKICTHLVQHIDELGQILNITQPNDFICNENFNRVIQSDVFFQSMIKYSIIPFQTSSYFFYKKDILEYKDSFLKLIDGINEFGDVPLIWYLISKGDIYYIDKVMSYYRENSVSSWSNKMHDKNYQIKHFEQIIDFFDIFNKYTNFKYRAEINNLIIEYEIKILSIQENYKLMLHEKYREYINRLPIINRMKIYIYGYFPFIKNKFKKLN